MKRLILATLATAAFVTPALAAEHYAVMDTVGNCSVLDAKPSYNLKVLGNAHGYGDHGAAQKFVKSDQNCKGIVS